MLVKYVLIYCMACSENNSRNYRLAHNPCIIMSAYTQRVPIHRTTNRYNIQIYVNMNSHITQNRGFPGDFGIVIRGIRVFFWKIFMPSKNLTLHNYLLLHAYYTHLRFQANYIWFFFNHLLVALCITNSTVCCVSY